MKYDHIAGWIAALALLATTAAWGQPWRPDKVTEFITSYAATRGIMIEMGIAK